jgi:hypothetical protein
MLTISKPLSASQAQTYHVREFASQEQNYWSRRRVGRHILGAEVGIAYGARGRR